MNESQAQQLTERIKREAPHLNAEAVRHGYPGYDEAWYIKISIWRDGITSSTELDDEHAWLALKTSMEMKESNQVKTEYWKTEHYLYTDGQITAVKPIAHTDVQTELVGIRTHDSFVHEIQFVTTEKWPYPFLVHTRISIEGKIVYIGNTWFTKLADLLEYLAKYLPPEETSSHEAPTQQDAG